MNLGEPVCRLVTAGPEGVEMMCWISVGDVDVNDDLLHCLEDVGRQEGFNLSQVSLQEVPQCWVMLPDSWLILDSPASH